MTAPAAAERSSRSRTMLAAALMLINIPLLLVGIEGVKYHVRNRSSGTIVSSGVTREQKPRRPLGVAR